MNSDDTVLVPIEQITPSIFTVREQLVMFDFELAVFYGVTTKAFNEELRRSRVRFPADFAFQLSVEEAGCLAAQFVPLDIRSAGLPYAFTEHGALMAAMILNSPYAMEMGAQVAVHSFRCAVKCSTHSAQEGSLI